MKLKIATIAALVLLNLATAKAEAPCDIRLGYTLGVPVVEFTSENVVHSKIPVKEMTSASLHEELINLQDEGLCEEKVQRKRCILKFEKTKTKSHLTLIRGGDRWLSWNLSMKNSAQEFTKRLQKAGFCL